MRRKGERPLPKTIIPYDDDHPVARMMRSGDRWFHAWMAQFCTPYDRLTKATGIAIPRLQQIESGAPITRAEVDRLAGAWRVTPEDLVASIGAASEFIP